MSNATDFWWRVFLKRDALLANHGNRLERFNASRDIAEWQGQPPKGDAVYLVSTDSDRCSTTAGSICLATLLIAAQRIIEGSHTIATPDQIAEHLLQEAERGREIAALERAAQLRRQGETLNA
jgi:hypothetical protein